MKKIFVLLILLMILLLNSYSNQTDFSFSTYFNSGTITKYTEDNCNASILPNISINSNGKIIGESIYFEQLEVGNALSTLKAKVLFTEYISNRDLTVIYCSSPLIEKSVMVKDYSVNLQIATTDNYTVIGWPMILGSF